MLRIAQRLIKYSYNNNDLTRHAPKIPLEIEPIKLKTKFKEGQRPQYIYDAKIKFDEDFKPYKVEYSSAFLVSFIIVMSYLTIRYERIRKLKGKTITHQYGI